MKKTKKPQIHLTVKNFSQASKADQDKAIKWLRQLTNDFVRMRKNISSLFIGDY